MDIIMEAVPKRNLKNFLKALVLSSDGISRKELAAKSGLDVRTVSGYIDDFLKKKIITEKNAETSGRGRPSVLYFSNSGNLAFSGIIIRAKSLEFCCCTANGDIISEGWEDFNPDQETKLKTVNRILEKAGFLKNAAELQGKTIAGIGIAVSRWIQPPLSAYDLYSDIASIVERECGVPVFSTTPINAALYHVRNLQKSAGNMLIIHPGIVLEFGIMISGSIPEDAREIEKNFSHICVDENGPLCYCGKKGCLEHYVTQAAITDMLKAENRKDGITAEYPFDDGLKRGIPAYLRTAEIVSDSLARSLDKFCRQSKIEAVNLFGMPDLLASNIIEKLKKFSVKNDGNEIIFSTFRQINIARASSLMAAFEVVRNFEKNSLK